MMVVAVIYALFKSLNFLGRRHKAHEGAGTGSLAKPSPATSNTSIGRQSVVVSRVIKPIQSESLGKLECVE